MKVITTNLLNRFWKKGITPMKEELKNKIDTNKIVASTKISEAGKVMDGKTVSEEFARLNSDLTLHKTTHEFLQFDLVNWGQEYTTVSAGEKFPFNLSINKCAGISYSNGTVTIADGSISLVRVYANVGGSSEANRIWLRLSLNGYDYANNLSQGTYINSAVEAIIPVKKGDKIYCYVSEKLYAGGGGLQNNMYIERLV